MCILFACVEVHIFYRQLCDESRMNVVESLLSTDCIICLSPLISRDEISNISEGRTSTASDSGVVRYAPGVREQMTPDDEEEAFANVAVLPCGHLFHFLCFTQFSEYRTTACCPVCRAPASSEDAVRLRLRPCPKQLGKRLPSPKSTEELSSFDECSAEKVRDLGSCEDSSGRKALCRTFKRDRAADEDAETSEAQHSAESPIPGLSGSDDVVLVKENRIGPSEAYRDLLRRTTLQTTARLSSLRSRKKPLTSKYQQLEEEVLQLRASVEAAERRMSLLQGNSSQDHLKELRKMSQELKFSLDSTTSEVAAVMRETSALSDSTEKYSARVKEMQKRLRSDQKYETRTE